jgi:hypothetical protein
MIFVFAVTLLTRPGGYQPKTPRWAHTLAGSLLGLRLVRCFVGLCVLGARADARAEAVPI